MAAIKEKIITVDDANKTLEDSLQQVFDSERFQDLMNLLANMKHYSLRNNLLIMAQSPDSTMTMGYKDWAKLGRQVNQGEKSIKILAPMTRKQEKEVIDKVTQKPKKDSKGNTLTEQRTVLNGFKPVSVFDVSQTSGKEIPSVRDFISKSMEDDAYMKQLYHDYKNFLVDTKGLDIKEQPTDKGVGGYFSRTTGEIVISSSEGKNDTEKFRVLVHEYAHSQVHHKESPMKDLPRGHKEAQAESVAYIVNQYYGMDISGASIGYIATWSQDMKLAKQAITEIQQTANSIIDEIELVQKEKIQSFYKETSKDYEEAKNLLISRYEIPEKAFNPETKEVTQLQLINKENGYILSGKLEYNTKTNEFFLRTNRNLIEPLSEIAKSGKLALLNVEKNNNKLKEVTAYSRIPDAFSVKKIRNGPYVVQSIAGKDIISKGFTSKDDANHFYLKASIGQALHHQSLLKSEKNNEQINDKFNTMVSAVEGHINNAVSSYLTNYSHAGVVSLGAGGSSIGWAILKNPSIRSIDDLSKFAEENKNVPSYKGLQSAIVHMNEKSNNEKELTLER